MGIPSLVRPVTEEAGSGSDRTGNTLDAAPPPPTPTATRRQDVANQHQQKHANLGFACFCPKESRARRPSFPCSKPPTATRRQDAATFRKASHRSGIPTPTRLTFTSAIQAAVLCPCAALPPSGLRLLSEHARGHGHPLARQTDSRGSRERKRPDRQHVGRRAPSASTNCHPATGCRQSAPAGGGPPRKGRHDVGTFREASRPSFP
jgi:hypothetical protein